MKKTGRIVCKPASKGSQKWLQRLVNDRPDLLNREIAKTLAWKHTADVDWVSPRKDDDYAEYRDQAFVDVLGLDLKRKDLDEFWPRKGACWDGLGKSDDGKIFLIEAKAHIPEILTPGTGAKEPSLAKIRRSLAATKRFVRSRSRHDWSMTFYQYTNRLAHLYLLRELNDIPAYLVFIYFLNDTEMRGPSSKDEWTGAINLVHAYLGLGRNRLNRYILDIFIDVRDLRKSRHHR